MNRVVLAIAAAMLYFVARGAVPLRLPLVIPVPVVRPVVRPVGPLSVFAERMTKQEREALSEAYAMLAKAVEANPVDEPVFVSTGAVRAAHRAALLCVWRGALGNEPEKYPGLREALEGMVSQSIGNDDIPLNPTIQKGAATAFSDISAALR